MAAKENEDPHHFGNEAMKKENYIEAMIHYTKAVKMSPRNHTLYANRSLAFLKAAQFFHAYQDAVSCIKLRPTWAKGHYRKAEVEFATEHFSQAILSYRNALMHSPEDTKIKDALKKAQREYKQQLSYEGRIVPLGVFFGILFSILAIAGDEILNDSPFLSHHVIKALVSIVIMGFCCIAGWLYKYIIQSQRESLLEPPIDLYPELADSDSSTSRDVPRQTQPKPKEENQGVRQRAKKNK